MQKKRVNKNLHNAIWFNQKLNLYFIGPKENIGRPLEEILPPLLKTSGTITCPHEAKIWSYLNGTEWVERNLIGMYIIGSEDIRGGSIDPPKFCLTKGRILDFCNFQNSIIMFNHSNKNS